MPVFLRGLSSGLPRILHIVFPDFLYVIRLAVSSANRDTMPALNIVDNVIIASGFIMRDFEQIEGHRYTRVRPNVLFRANGYILQDVPTV